MIRYCNLYLPSRLFVFIALDGLLITLVTMLALNAWHSHPFESSFFGSAGVVVAAVVVWLWCFYVFDLYDLDATRSMRDVLLQGLRALGTGTLLLAPVWWLLPSKVNSYRGLEVDLISFLAILCLYRLGAEWVHRRVLPGERILLVGNGPSIKLLSQALREKICLPLRLTGVVSEENHETGGGLAFAICGHLSDFRSLTESFKPDRVAIDLVPGGETLPAKDLVEVRGMGVRVDDGSALYEAITGRVPVEAIPPVRLAFGKSFRLSTFSAITYRITGVFLSSIALILVSPTMLLLAILIKLDSKGPIFYKQERVGAHGKTFFAIKFRSMRTDAETLSGPVWATDDDWRVTRVGKILRKFRLDELPQFWNVIRGEMGLVGPRPERPHFVKMLCEHIPYYDLRHSIPPGITGWAQVCASYGSNVEESQVKLEYDLFYLKNRSPLLDALILFKTVKIVLFGRGAR